MRDVSNDVKELFSVLSTGALIIILEQLNEYINLGIAEHRGRSMDQAEYIRGVLAGREMRQ